MDMDFEISRLLGYALDKGLIDYRDRYYGLNRVLDYLDLDGIDLIDAAYRGEKIFEILDVFRLWAIENDFVNQSPVELDLFDTGLMACLVKSPSELERDFKENYRKSPKLATDSFYDFSIATNYIREDRVKKDLKWKYPSEYGPIDISINLSKPEKDPRDIIKAKALKSSSYPKCPLCKENEGYRGRLNHPARGNHRLIALDLEGEEWYMQYSPYIYYREHSIVFKGQHEPMKIEEASFRRLLAFVEAFPHYFVGSNADLPIVGGSILSHDHFQAGNYSFTMAEAREENRRSLGKVELSTLCWPMSVIRLRGQDKKDLVDWASRILENWRSYDNRELGIISRTDEDHNTITPIARFREGFFELDLVLRNNRRTESRPMGLFHPREDYHHIKKENIGLIEVMGLAVLPARLKDEMEELKPYLLEGNLDGLPEDLELHRDWAAGLLEKYRFNSSNIDGILEEEIGRVFLKVLLDAGVFKRDEKGQKEFRRALDLLVEG